MLMLGIAAALSALLAATSAGFTVSGLSATDLYIPSADYSHYVSFQVAWPGSPYGNAVSNCSLAWDKEAPTCYASCPGNASVYFAARICPGSFEGAGQFAVEISSSWFYEAPGAANTSVSYDYTDTDSGYWCSTGAQTKVCFSNNVTEADMYFGNPYAEVDYCHD